MRKHSETQNQVLPLNRQCHVTEIFFFFFQIQKYSKMVHMTKNLFWAELGFSSFLKNTIFFKIFSNIFFVINNTPIFWRNKVFDHFVLQFLFEPIISSNDQKLMNLTFDIFVQTLTKWFYAMVGMFFLLKKICRYNMTSF